MPFPDGDKTATVKVKVTDNDGGSTTDSEDVVIVEIANVAPVVTAAAISLRTRASPRASTWARSPTRATTPTGRSSRLGATVRRIPCTTGTKGPLGGRPHTFGDGDATYTVIVTVTDKDGVSDSATFDVVVSNVAPTVVLSGADAAAEGDVVHYTYSIFDPGNDTVQSVDASCGDGGDLVPGSASNTDTSRVSSIACSRTVRRIGGVGLCDRFRRRDRQHRFGFESSSRSHNVAPTVVLTGADEVTEGTTHTYTFTVNDPGDDTFTVVAGFPDCDAGATNTACWSGLAAAHRYGGSFKCSFPDGDATATVTIKVDDSDGPGDATPRMSWSSRSPNVAPEVTAAADQASDEGESNCFDLGSFTDPGDDADWTVDVDWGDGSDLSSFTTAQQAARRRLTPMRTVRPPTPWP